MGRRFITERADNIPNNRWYAIWNKAGIGRYWKRQLSKSRRRAWKEGHEGQVNNKYKDLTGLVDRIIWTVNKSGDRLTSEIDGSDVT